ncbi:MAG: ABC transporter permease [Clostridia bacterium]|nr:ABC transporter permease [Clostridia bacterium]
MKEKDHVFRRWLTCLKADLQFQFKQGFYFVYLILLLVYLVLLEQFSPEIVKLILPILIYIDPSILGMFFIGGIILLEKQQGILSLLHISPLKVHEYLVSKLISLSFISLLVGVVLSLFSYQMKTNFIVLVTGIIVSAVFYTLIGMIISTHSKSINGYFINVIPWMLLIVIPNFLLLLPNQVFWFNLIPPLAGLKLVFAAYYPASGFEILFNMAYLIIIDMILFVKAKKIVESKMIFDE